MLCAIGSVDSAPHRGAAEFLLTGLGAAIGEAGPCTRDSIRGMPSTEGARVLRGGCRGVAPVALVVESHPRDGLAYPRQHLRSPVQLGGSVRIYMGQEEHNCPVRFLVFIPNRH